MSLAGRIADVEPCDGFDRHRVAHCRAHCPRNRRRHSPQRVDERCHHDYDGGHSGDFGTIFAFLIETQLFFQNIGAGFEISVYLADNARLDDVKPKIMSVGHVKSLEIIPKERAWTDMRKNLNAPDIDNPLPDTIHVRMDGKEYIPGAVEKSSAFRAFRK